MESNITDEHFWSLESPPAEPHFDEEATLLSARRVVPIKRLTQKPGLASPWVFGFALVGALLLGVAATALYYSRLHIDKSQPATDSETVSSGAQGGQSEAQDFREPPPGAPDAARVGGTSVDSDTLAKVKSGSSSVSSPARTPDSSNAGSKKPTHRRATVVVDQSSEPEYESREERREARRDAREWKRAKRERRAGKASDELLRIREIFEGPPRP